VCNAELHNRLTEYDRFIAQKQYWNAYLQLNKCAEILNRDELRAKSSDADVMERQSIIANPKATQREKADAMAVLVRDYPAKFSHLVEKMETLNKKLDADDKKHIKAERRKEGVFIGMTMQDVRDSSWGRPESINRTTFANSSREQWVYGLRNYLYFKNGVLSSIQN
jgi:hypothetical protein